nr:hypothetical protein [Luteibacter rhizovicinus]
MKKAVLLDAEELNLEDAKVKIEAALDLKLLTHESDYHGGSYFRYDSDGSSLILQDNFVEDDGETTEAEFPLSKVLIYLSGGAVAVDDLVAKLTERSRPAVVLRSSTY